MDDNETQTNFGAIANLVAELAAKMKAGAVEDFLSGADPWLIAKAMTTGATVVTHESYHPDEKKAQQLLGQVFTIRKEQVKFGKMDCGKTEFDAHKVEPQLHLREAFHASSKQLGMPTPVTVVDLSCTSVFITKPNHLVIFWQGWFFDAVRVKK